MSYCSKEMARFRQKINKFCPVCKAYFCCCQIGLGEWLENDKDKKQIIENNNTKRKEWESA